MKRTKVTSTVMALAFALVLGFAGIAGAQSHMMGYQNMSPEQYKVMQDMHVEFDKKAEPLRQQLYAKQAELNALYYQGTPQNDPKVQSLLKDIGDLDGKLYAVRADFRKQLNSKGIPVYGGMGYGDGCPMMGMMGSGHGCPMMGMMGSGHGGGMMGMMGPGHGGMMGQGMMQRGGCGW